MKMYEINFLGNGILEGVIGLSLERDRMIIMTIVGVLELQK
jgi:hypothetical protein